jgi:serine/threonine-protein kinase HipA
VSAPQLTVLLSGTDAGRVTRDSRRRLSFVYDDAWRRSADAYPLSLSMPLGAAEHPHDRIEPFLWGLLPDNDRIIDRWARDFHVGRDAFSLLAHVGEDCAGAVQLLPDEPGRSGDPVGRGRVEWITEDDVAERLRALRTDQAAWRRLGDSGQFSLAGAQAKTALLLRDGRWGIPSGRTPTTHILKPPVPDLAGHVENEHFCLELAREVGLPTARSEVRHFASEVALVVERYDRVRHRGGVLRLHQEDCCQALGVMPTRKYENQGGPGPRHVIELLREASSAPLDDVRTFVDALAFSWLVAGTDAHAKNYSLLLASEGRVRLAPLYDLGSILLYPELETRKIKLAMKIGSTYVLEQIGRRHWATLAKDARLHPDEVLERVCAMAEGLPDAAERVAGLSRSSGLSAATIDRLAAAIARHARDCRTALD